MLFSAAFLSEDLITAAGQAEVNMLLPAGMLSHAGVGTSLISAVLFEIRTVIMMCEVAMFYHPPHVQEVYPSETV